MATDKHGLALKVGDRVCLECVILAISEDADGCNLELQTVEPIPPGNHRPIIAAANTRMVSMMGTCKVSEEVVRDITAKVLAAGSAEARG